MIGKDFLVIGSGLAGLIAALRAAEHGLGRRGLAKREPLDANTAWAQGGIAASVGADDEPAIHRRGHADLRRRALPSGRRRPDGRARRPARSAGSRSSGSASRTAPTAATTWVARAGTRAAASCTPATSPGAR